MKTNFHRKVADAILTDLKNGHAPWVQPWKAGSDNVRGATKPTIPRNAISGRRYSGANVFLLWGAAIRCNYVDGRWLTFKQAKECGASIRKGEHGEKVYFISRVTREDRKDPTKQVSIPFLKEYTVFNLAQCEGVPAKVLDAKPVPFFTTETGGENTMDDFREFVDATSASIDHGGDRAFYSPKFDRIAMPLAGAFKERASYQATLAHELVHWTGAKDRLDRKISNRFGSEGYAAEELVAELGAAMLCAEFGIVGELRHAGYIATWIKLLTDHDGAFFAAASAASRALEWMGNLVNAEAYDADEAPDGQVIDGEPAEDRTAAIAA